MINKQFKINNVAADGAFLPTSLFSGLLQIERPLKPSRWRNKK